MKCSCGAEHYPGEVVPIARKEDAALHTNEYATNPTMDTITSVEKWIRGTEAGKDWLAKMAADTGVPLQLALPFGTPNKENKRG